MEDKLRALMQLAELQNEVAVLFVRAEATKLGGDYRAAQAAYASYVDRASSQLQRLVDFNARFQDSPFSLPEAVQPLINALMVSADIAYALGERAAAESLRKRALELSQTYLGHRGSVETERSRAGALTLEGRFNEALVALMAARDFALQSGNALAAARVALDIADILHWLGDLRRAKEELDHAAAIVEPMVGDGGMGAGDVVRGVLTSVAAIMAGKGDPGDAVRAVNLYRAFTEVTYYRGLVAKALGQWKEAEDCFMRVLPRYREVNAEAGIEFQLVQVAMGQGRHPEALARARRLAPTFERSDFRPKRAVMQRVIAECLLALGDEPDSALRLADQSIEDLSERHFDPDALWRSQRLRAQILKQKGRSGESLAAFRAALATIRDLRKAPLGYRLDSTFLADKTDLYGAAIDVAASSGQAADCCCFMEDLKSRTLAAVLSIPRAEGAAGEGLAARFDELTRELDSMEYGAYRSGWVPELRARHREALETRADLIERIRISDPRWRSLSQPVPLDLDAAARTLAQRSQALLTLHYQPDRVAAALLCAGELRCESLPLDAAVRAKLAAYAANLQKAQPDIFQHDLSVEFGVEARHLVPAELLRRALAARSLVVVPHGVLHLVPWAALVHEGRRLFEHLAVGLAPNLACAIREARFSRPAGVALLGVARYPGLEALGDLPSTRAELDDVSQLYRAAAVPVDGPELDAAATATRLWKMSSAVSGAGHTLHLSCHGTLALSEPMSSGLLMSDSKVDAAEVARRGLAFDEVVLSACSTGWRPTRVGDVELNADEILGIPGGFLEAGAKAVLLSIPKAEGKAARQLTTHYHERRAAGESPLASFQSAQRRMLEAGTSPGAWVGFALYGA